MSARARASMSSASTSSATPAPRTRSSAASSAWPKATRSAPRRFAGRKTRLTDLGYFQSVDIATNPGSAPDKAILTTNIDEKATGELTFGGGYSTDAGALVDIGLSERNLVGTGINASINGVLAQRRSSINASVTDPYFLDRNLVAGVDVFLIQTNFLGTEPYDEKRVRLRAAPRL